MLSKIKFIAVLISLISLSTQVKATNEIPPTKIKALSVSLIAKGKVAINATITDSNNMFEIERSYDNINFQTVAVLMPNMDVTQNQDIKLKDNVKKGKKTVYYRLKQISDSMYTIEDTKSLSLK
jgi:hypothetical protein